MLGNLCSALLQASASSHVSPAYMQDQAPAPLPHYWAVPTQWLIRIASVGRVLRSSPAHVEARKKNINSVVAFVFPRCEASAGKFWGKKLTTGNGSQQPCSQAVARTWILRTWKTGVCILHRIALVGGKGAESPDLCISQSREAQYSLPMCGRGNLKH